MLRSFLLLLAVLISQSAFAQTKTFHQVSSYNLRDAQAELMIQKLYRLGEGYSFSRIKMSDDARTGMSHQRYQVLFNGKPIDGAIVTAHSKNGILQTITGFVPQDVTSSQIGITESHASTKALQHVNAEQYAWQSQKWENRIKYSTNNPNATWKPIGELMFVPQHGKFRKDNYVSAYRFDVYATKPLSRKYVYVSAANGEVLFTEERIHDIVVPGVAQTAYSGTQSIMVDSFSGGYRLRETSRGNGIETYNELNGTDINDAVDFTDADNNWNNVNAALDQYATDAHWGAEKTYDYFMDNHNRNSIDDDGLKIISYVHEDVDLVNAFWDGEYMHFGDGNSDFPPLTCLDIVGHELAHGITQYTAGLNYQDESGALNESFSDIFGTAIEFAASPGGGNYLIGEQLGSAFRSMSDPTDYQNPGYYQGDYWYTGAGDNGGVHYNSGVQNHWFYILANGDAGTNEGGNNYSVTGLGIDAAAAIAYRALSVYLFPSAEYSDARDASIQAAVDIYGPCTPQVQAVADAWYAVGVGDAYVAEVNATFTANGLQFCAPPATALFYNGSFNAGTYLWNFGDGDTSTEASPQHVYNDFGSYTVTLIASGGACGVDTFVATNFIQIDSIFPCITSLPNVGTLLEQQCSGILYDNGGPANNYSDNIDSRVTIAPPGATGLVVDFDEFYLEEDYDYLYLYDGPDITSPLIGTYTDNNLPQGGSLILTGPVLTVRLTSDVALNHSGFKMNWQCLTAVPLAAFGVDNTSSCSGAFQFSDNSFSSPSTWFWDFGDGNTSSLENPQHNYESDGTYDVKLIVTNAFGSDTLIMPAYVIVDKPNGPSIQNGSTCIAGTVDLTATPTNATSMIQWYDASIGGSQVGIGSIFTTPVINSNTTYYAEEIVNYPIVSGGLPDNSLSGSYYSNSTDRYLIFDVYTPVKLQTVTMYADGDGNRTVQLRDAAGLVLADTTVDLADGTNVVGINFNLPAQDNLRLGISGDADLYRNNGSATFPYDVPGILSITGSNANPDGYYYYFYDWKLQLPSCISERVPVEAAIGATTVSFNPAGPVSVCDNNLQTIQALGGNAFQWSTGTTSSSITPTTSGTYAVTISDVGGCSAVGNIDVNISQSPVANFTWTQNALVATFANNSTSANSYEWNFGDGATSTLENPNHTYTNSGDYTVTLTATNTNGCSDTITNDISIVTSIATVSISSVQLYPNPSSNLLVVNLDKSYENAMLVLTDELGREVLRNNLTSRKTSTDVTTLAAGFYNATIHLNNSKTVKKLVKL